MAFGERRLIWEEDILQALKANPPSHRAEDIESMKMDGGNRNEAREQFHNRLRLL